MSVAVAPGQSVEELGPTEQQLEREYQEKTKVKNIQVGGLTHVSSASRGFLQADSQMATISLEGLCRWFVRILH